MTAALTSPAHRAKALKANSAVATALSLMQEVLEEFSETLPDDFTEEQEEEQYEIENAIQALEEADSVTFGLTGTP